MYANWAESFDHSLLPANGLIIVRILTRDRIDRSDPIMVALCNRAGHMHSFFLTSSQPSQIGCLPYFHTWCGLRANLECRSETCCARLDENTGCKKVAKNRHLGTIAQICRAISSQLRHVSTIGKNLLSSNISSTCHHNMVNFGPLAAEIVSLVWFTPANFNGFRILPALLYTAFQ